VDHRWIAIGTENLIRPLSPRLVDGLIHRVEVIMCTVSGPAALPCEGSYYVPASTQGVSSSAALLLYMET